MKLTKVQITRFKSIDDSNEVLIDPSTTVLVGQNESGKTAFLQALHKAYSIEKDIGYEIVEDYPRKGFSDYEFRHEEEPDVVARLTYKLSDNDVFAINTDLKCQILKSLQFTLIYKYDNTRTVSISVPEDSYVQYLLDISPFPKEVKESLEGVHDLCNLFSTLENQDLNAESESFTEKYKSIFNLDKKHSWEVLDFYIWKYHIAPGLPKFLYFDEYKILPGKVNLTSLKNRKNSNNLTEEDKTVLALLHLAKLDIDNLLNPDGYEKSRSRLEAISNSISDKIFKYWTQNQDLAVQFDVKTDPDDLVPFNNGVNLYIRIWSQKHRVTVPFNQRSKGFIWFFSFLVWFDGIKAQFNTNSDLILLLDEPGLSLHALAQQDLLQYINNLSKSHQILYTTHSPFMVNGENLNQVRTVEDQERQGTKVSGELSNSDSKTLFPLQAALGYSIAQNLFISPKNLLVEGPADLIFLKYFSSKLDEQDRVGLRDDITIVPVGGLGNIPAFISLLAGNDLKIVVLHDYDSKPEQKLENLVRQKLIQKKSILHYGMFRAKNRKDTSKFLSSDVEDMIPISSYLNLFNKAFEKELNGIKVKVSDLSAGERIIKKIERFLEQESIQIRPSGGFNHYRVAEYLASHPNTMNRKSDAPALDYFESLFKKANSLL